MFVIGLAIVTASETIRHEYCVIGAGPAGLQFASFLQEKSRDYVVFERSSHVASFFDRYPISRIMNSAVRRTRVNASVDSETFLRADELSLIAPAGSPTCPATRGRMPASSYQTYLSHFTAQRKINIETCSEVLAVRPASGRASTKPQALNLRVGPSGSADCHVQLAHLLPASFTSSNPPQPHPIARRERATNCVTMNVQSSSVP